MNAPENKWWVTDMSDYAIPKFSREKVNTSGKVLLSVENEEANKALSANDLMLAFDIIDNWRASHAYPLQVFYNTLRNRAKKIYKTALVTQRTKRLISILEKLKREDQMKLSQMQDIGGCRAVLPTLAQVRRLERIYYSQQFAHDPLNHKDYIEHPQESGYRGIHLKYKYRGAGEKAIYNDLKIEIQLRTNLQHTWATAVETAGTFTKQALKSYKGDENWLRFFSLMSSVFAIREKCPVVPRTSNDYAELCSEIRALNNKHQIVRNFAGTTAILSHIRTRKREKFYFLVTLNPDDVSVEVKEFGKRESQAANKEYTRLERDALGTNKNVVLVSAASIKALERAYPNYFLDSREFLSEILDICPEE